MSSRVVAAGLGWAGWCRRAHSGGEGGPRGGVPGFAKAPSRLPSTSVGCHGGCAHGQWGVQGASLLHIWREAVKQRETAGNWVAIHARASKQHVRIKIHVLRRHMPLMQGVEGVYNAAP